MYKLPLKTSEAVYLANISSIKEYAIIECVS
jgi:hypothetical protein